jgi:glucose 1-dehydrogenase
VGADVADEAQVQAMFARMLDEFGTIDILVNNAGLQQDAPFDQLTLKQWSKVIGVNLTGQFLCAREAVREFKRRGVNAEIPCAAGRILCISSVHKVIPWAGHVNYATSKVCRSAAPAAKNLLPFIEQSCKVSEGGLRGVRGACRLVAE